MVENNRVIAISEDLFTEVIVLVGTLDQIQDKVVINKQMNVFQKKVLLKNKENTKRVLKDLEILCDSL